MAKSAALDRAKHISGVLLSATSMSVLCLPTVTHAQNIAATDRPVRRDAPVSGDVVTIRSGEDIQLVSVTARRQLVAGQSLKAGDIIRTNASGTVAIVFADQSQVRLGRNTTLEVRQVTRGTPSQLRLQSGRLWGRAPTGRSRLGIETPSATAAIRGTEWTLEVTDKKTALIVITGEVALSNSLGALAVAAGQAAAATPYSAPSLTVLVNRAQREQLLYTLDARGDAREQTEPALVAVRALASSGDLSAARDQLSAIPSRSPARYILAARLALLADAEAVGEAYILEGLARHPDEPGLLALHAEFQTNYRGRPDIGLALAERAAHFAPQSSDTLLTLSRIQLERRATIAAMLSINAAIRLRPDDIELLIHRARIAVAQNRPHAAKKDLAVVAHERPDSPTLRLAQGEISAVLADPTAALPDMLAASAANPGYAVGLQRLAEAYGRLGENDVARQQLDAADRLDPNAPQTPLFRNALALHNNQSDLAITAANEALRRFKNRGGIYDSLGENRESGSSLSRTFRFLNLQASARYFGDRVYDPFTATSYFDAVLNEEAGLFNFRQDNAGFNPRNGDDIAQTSTFLRGVTLDPLSIANSQRRLQTSRTAFMEGVAEGRTIQSNLQDLYRGRVSFAMRAYPQIKDGELPFALSLTAQASKFEDKFLSSVRDARAYEAYLGVAITPTDNVVFNGSFRTESYNISADRQAYLQQFGGEHDFTEDQYFATLLWTHSLGFRHDFTVGGGYDRKADLDIFFRPVNGSNLVSERTTLREGPRTYFITGNYRRGIGALDLQFGAESYWTSDLKRRSIAIVNGANEVTAVGATAVDSVQRHELRVYGNATFHMSDAVALEGQIALVRARTNSRMGGVTQHDSDDQFNARLGIAWEPLSGHWLRAMAARETTTILPITLAPIYALGLRGAAIPGRTQSQQDVALVRWEARWSPVIFTAVEIQHQTAESIRYLTPDGDAPIRVSAVRINQFQAEVNLTPGGNWGVHARYTRAWTSGLIDGQPTFGALPFIPNNLAEFGATWTHPSHVVVSLTGRYVGPQTDVIRRRLGPHTQIDTAVRWETLNRHLEFSAGILNLLSSRYEIQVGVPAPQRAFFISAKVRL